jgi:hypothetical protein
MKIKSSIILPNDIKFLIIEIREYQFTNLFDNRFQLVLEINGKIIFPMLKKKFFKFRDNGYLYHMKSDKYDYFDENDVLLDAVSYHKLQICDKSLEECNCELMNYISMYNNGEDLKKELKKVYKS